MGSPNFLLRGDEFLRKHGPHPDLDRPVGVCAGSHHEKKLHL